MVIMRLMHCCANEKYELASIFRSESEVTLSSGVLGVEDFCSTAKTHHYINDELYDKTGN